MEKNSLEERVSHLERELQKISSQNKTLSDNVEKALSTLLPKVDALLSSHKIPEIESPLAGTSKSFDVSPMSCSTSSHIKGSALLDVPMSEAANVDKSVARFLQLGALPFQRNEEGKTPLHLAAASGYDNVLVQLVKTGATVQVKGPRLRTALHFAAANGHEGCMRYLVSAGAQLNDKDMDGSTPLMLAVRSGHLNATSLLLSLGATPNECNSKGENSLIIAIKENHWEIANIFLKEGSCLRQEKNAMMHDSGEETLLSVASEFGALTVLTHLLKNNITGGEEDLQEALSRAKNAGVAWTFNDIIPGIFESKMGGFAIREAAMTGRKETLITLIDAGIDIDSVNSNKWNPLLLAACEGHPDCLRTLLERGAKRDLKTKEGWNALHNSAANGHLECLGILLDSGMKINSITRTRDTALTLAASNGHANCVNMLLNRGANAKHINRDDKNALDLAENHHRSNCVQILNEWIGDEND